jgi:hypothetical protein
MTKPIKDLVKNGKHFCVLPWIHFHSWPDGRVMPCCVADSSKPVSKIKKYESLVTMMNTEDYKKMRQAMLNDEPVEACKRCYELETLGTWTMRNSHNKRRGEELVEYIENVTKEDGSISDFKLKYMDIRFSNLCNMKCRSCGPSCSSLWAQEFLETKGLEQSKKYFGITKMVVNSNEDQIFMAKLKPYLKDVEEVYFAGGEILITQEHYECLDFWVKNNLQDKVELSYTTNLSSLKFKDKDLIEYWKKFPKLQIWASLDASGETAELIRKGTDWSKIKKNLKEIKELVPHAKIEITPTISIWNIFSFYKMFDELFEEGYITKDSTPRFNIATSPWFASIMILPEFSKIKLNKLYSSYVEKYSYNPHIKAGFQVIQQTIKSGSPRYGDRVDRSSKEGILEFKKFNEELDQFRSESHLDIIPELKEIYKWAES